MSTRPVATRGASTRKPVRAEPAAGSGAPVPLRVDDSGVRHVMGYRIAIADVQTRRAFKQHVGGPLKLSAVEFTALLILQGHEGATAAQLARVLDMPPPNMTVLLDRLAARELLERRRSDSDRRAHQLLLTEAGRELTQRARELSHTMEAALLSRLTDGEQAMLGELLAKLCTPRPLRG